MTMPLALVVPCIAQGALSLLSQLAEPNPGPKGFFGESLAISAGTLAIGSEGFKEEGAHYGAVHVYTGYGAQWTHTAELHDPSPTNSGSFGYAIALQGDDLIVGAFQDRHSTLGIQSGSVHVFRRTGTSWNYVQLLEQTQPVDLGGYGSHLALAGNTLFVCGHGGISVYERQGSSWVEQPSIPYPGSLTTPWGYAYQLQFDGTRLVVGAPVSFNGSILEAGVVHLFTRNGTGWMLEQTIGASDASTKALFGSALSLRGDQLAVGAVTWPNFTFQGKVYVFERVGGTWQETQSLTASDGGAAQEFGRSVTLFDDRLYVGAAGANSTTMNECGALYVFQHNGSAWVQTQKITAQSPTIDASFGWRQARWLDNLFVSAVSEKYNGDPYEGKVYVYDITSAAPFESYCTSALTTHGCVPRLSATGVASASATSGFVLRADDVEGQRPGLLFYGVSGREFVPWASTGTAGYLCVHPPTQRAPPQNSGGTLFACDGSMQLDWNAFRASYPTSLGQPFVAGAVVDAQAWFREPGSAKTTALSDALEFVVLP